MPPDKRLDNLTRRFPDNRRLGAAEFVTGVTVDSRCVQPGYLFIALQGYAADGHEFIPEALARGAVAVIFDKPAYAEAIPASVGAILVPNSRRAAAEVAAEFWDHPSRDLTVVGVTGTNGKTTTAFLVDSIFRAGGACTGLLGTTARFVGGEAQPADRTTPDSVELQRLLAQMRAEGVTHVTMEVSSHGLVQDRTWMCAFDAAIFTNLTQDHFDFHVDLEDYFAAKLRLFTEYVAPEWSEKSLLAVLNVDDPAGMRLCALTPARIVPYGLSERAAVTASEVQITPGGIDFRLHLGEQEPVAVHLALTGAFNLYNALGAAACAWGLGVPTDQIVAGLAQLEAVPGRFERVALGQDFTVIVDYAHTPDALANVLRAARALTGPPARLLCVFGCGGDRDRSKRPQMGRLATEQSDLAIITSDNPRSEPPQAIIDEIAGGVASHNYLLEPDRRRAIFLAVEQCAPGDTLVIAGKGHETYQIIGDRTIPFDDRAVAREAIVQLLGDIRGPEE